MKPRSLRGKAQKVWTALNSDTVSPTGLPPATNSRMPLIAEPNGPASSGFSSSSSSDSSAFSTAGAPFPSSEDFFFFLSFFSFFSFFFLSSSPSLSCGGATPSRSCLCTFARRADSLVIVETASRRHAAASTPSRRRGVASTSAWRPHHGHDTASVPSSTFYLSCRPCPSCPSCPWPVLIDTVAELPRRRRRGDVVSRASRADSHAAAWTASPRRGLGTTPSRRPRKGR